MLGSPSGKQENGNKLQDKDFLILPRPKQSSDCLNLAINNSNTKKQPTRSCYSELSINKFILNK